MKKFRNMKNIFICTTLSVMITFSFSFKLAAQDSTKARTKKGVVVLKIRKDDNGKTTVIDTTFNIATPAGHAAFEEYMAKHEKESEDLGKEIDNIEVLVDVPDFPDSSEADSVIKQFKFFAKDIQCPHFKGKNKPQGWDYEFEIPCPPDFDLPPFQGYEDFDGEFHPGPDMKVFRYDNKGQTLSDILGDIPMDRIKSYSIKDRKNGKRIIIDIEDAPLLENQQKVIIMQGPVRPSHKKIDADHH
jgi:hypothetical protein